MPWCSCLAASMNSSIQNPNRRSSLLSEVSYSMFRKELISWMLPAVDFRYLVEIRTEIESGKHGIRTEQNGIRTEQNGMRTGVE